MTYHRSVGSASAREDAIDHCHSAPAAAPRPWSCWHHDRDRNSDGEGGKCFGYWGTASYALSFIHFNTVSFDASHCGVLELHC